MWTINVDHQWTMWNLLKGVKLVVELELALDKYESLLCCVAKNLDFYLWETFSDTCSM